MKKGSFDVKAFVAQFVLIVFSVMLGLYLSERIEEQKRIKDSKELLATIKSEVKDNIELLEYWVPYHQEAKIKLDSLSKDSLLSVINLPSSKDCSLEELLWAECQRMTLGILPNPIL